MEKIYLNKVENGALVKEEIKDINSFISHNGEKPSNFYRKYKAVNGFCGPTKRKDGNYHYISPEALNLERKNQANYARNFLGKRKTPLQKMFSAASLKPTATVERLTGGKIKSEKVWTSAQLSPSVSKRLKMLLVYKEITIDEFMTQAVNTLWNNTKHEF